MTTESLQLTHDGVGVFKREVCTGAECDNAIRNLATVLSDNSICAGKWALWSPNRQVENPC